MAGLNVLKVFQTVVGDRRFHVYTVDFDSSYPTGGESLTKAQLGFAATTDPEFHVSVLPKAGYVFEYDYTNAKVIAYWVDTTVDGAPMAEVVDTTSLAALTLVRVEAWGRFQL